MQYNFVFYCFQPKNGCFGNITEPIVSSEIQRSQTVHKWLTDYRPQYLQLLCGRVLYTIKTIAKTLRKLEMFQKKFMLSMAINRVRFINNHLVLFPVALSFSALFLKTPQKQKRDCVKSRMPMQCIQCIHSRH